MRRRLLIAALILAALLVAATRLAAPLARPALGFVAKVVCSGVFVGGMSIDRALADLPDEPAAHVIRTRVDMVAGTVRASVPLIASRVAAHRDGLGCTLRSVNGALVPLPRRALPELAAPHDFISAAPGPDWDYDRLGRALDAAFAEPDSAVVRRTRAVVVVHRGRIIAERYADGFSREHRFPGWSMAKSVTAALAGILIGDGRLALTDTALHPSWREHGDPRAGITLRQLLHMSSGLDFDESYTPRGDATRLLFGQDDVAAAAARSPLAHTPGSVWYYSSATTNLLAYRIREVLGDTAYADFPQRALFHRIGVAKAVLEPDAAGTFVGSSFLYATARDWARFGMLFLQDGVWNGARVLPEGWVRFSTTPAPAAPLGRYGAHWWLNAGEAADTARRPWPDLPRDIFWAAGFQGQYTAIVPSHDLVVVRLGVAAREGAWDLGAFLREVLAAHGDCSGPEVAPGDVAHNRSPGTRECTR